MFFKELKEIKADKCLSFNVRLNLLIRRLIILYGHKDENMEYLKKDTTLSYYYNMI